MRIYYRIRNVLNNYLFIFTVCYIKVNNSIVFMRLILNTTGLLFSTDCYSSIDKLGLHITIYKAMQHLSKFVLKVINGNQNNL